MAMGGALLDLQPKLDNLYNRKHVHAICARLEAQGTRENSHGPDWVLSFPFCTRGAEDLQKALPDLKSPSAFLGA